MPRKRSTGGGIQPRAAERFPHALFEADWPVPPHRLMLLDDVHPAVWILGHRRQEIVGEAYAVDAIIAAIDELDRLGRVIHSDDGHSVTVTSAWLVPEERNEHTHAPAVRIFVGQHGVGFLSLEAVARWYPILREMNARYQRPVACAAVIVGSVVTRKLGVWLMLDSDIRKTDIR